MPCWGTPAVDSGSYWSSVISLLVQRQGDVHRRRLLGGAQLDDGGAEDVHGDDEVRRVVGLVLVVLVVDPDADDAVAAELVCLPLQAQHRLRACVVQAAREVGQLLVLPAAAEEGHALPLLPAGHGVADGRAGDEAGGPPAVPEELGELLSREVREHGLLAEVEALRGNRRARRDELDQTGRPVVGAALQAYADDRIGACQLSLFREPLERQPARLVPGFRGGLELEGLTLLPRSRPEAPGKTPRCGRRPPC